MCLYTREKLPRVAKRDIVCLKILNKEFNEVYRTPYKGVKVQLNSKIEASPKKVDIIFSNTDYLDNTVYSINGGAVHSVLLDVDRCKENSCVKKAIIPKGTEYYLGCFGLEIASKELYITDKDGSVKDLDVQFLEELLEEAPTYNGIRVGDYLMTDCKFVHPRKKLSKTKTIGIVVGFHDETPLIAALDRFKNIQFGSYTSDIIEIEAPHKCVAYKKNGIENWYLPTLGEMLQMLNNALYINIAYLISGLGYLVDTNGWYWTSSEFCGSRYWDCGLYYEQVHYCWDYWYSSNMVVPFLAYNDVQKTIRQD